MRIAGFFLVSLLMASPALRAGVIVSTSLGLTSLAISPSTGSLKILSPLTASAFVSVFDSLGGANSDFETIDDSSITASAATALANGSGTASATALTARASSGVTIPGLDAEAGTNAAGPYGSLAGTFQITDLNGGVNPVNVDFAAILAGSQSLFTDTRGISANSEVIFQLNLPDIGAVPFLFLDSPLAIGSNQTLSNAINQTLTGTATLNTNTPYSVYVEVDAESTGVDSAVPEPSSLWLTAAGTIILFALCSLRLARERRASRVSTR
jgi:hypothetical protein